MFPKLYSNDSSINPLGKPITEEEDAWLGSLLNIGALIGPFFFLYVTDKFGRKPALLCIAIPVAVSYFISAFANKLYLFYIVRILGGISAGACYALTPNYVAEISEDSSRGQMSQMLNVFWAFGNFIVYSLGPFMNVRYFNILLSCIPTVFFVLFLLIAPESPYHLVKKDRIEDATKVIKFLWRKTEEHSEGHINHIRKGLLEEEKAGFSEIIGNSATRRVFLICIGLVLAQDLCGFTVILFYMQMIFKAAGMRIRSENCSLIISVFLFVSSFVSPFFIDRTGRRFLTIISLFGMSIGLLTLGIYFFAEDILQNFSWIPLACLILYVFSFNFGISSIPFTLISELFPTKIKNTVSTVVGLMSWFISFILTNSFNSMNHSLGHAGTFWIFAGFSFLSGIFSVLLVPETKGKSFSEIQRMLETGPTLQIIIRKGIEIKKMRSPI